jgi:hypothetical protein
MLFMELQVPLQRSSHNLPPLAFSHLNCSTNTALASVELANSTHCAARALQQQQQQQQQQQGTHVLYRGQLQGT